jgi:hypothetical protein
VNVEPAALRQLGTDHGVLVGAIGVDDHMHVQDLQDRHLNLTQEPQELLAPVTELALGHSFASSGHVESGEQGGDAGTDVVVGNALHIAQTHEQQRRLAGGAVAAAILRFHDSRCASIAGQLGSHGSPVRCP